MNFKVLGLDPGLCNTGWGIIEDNNSALKCIDYGVITSNKKESLPQRLAKISFSLDKILNTHIPTEAAVEETFVNKNPSSTLKLGMARGVILSAPARFGINVKEYSANYVKKTVVGVGHADKNQVAMMVRLLLSTNDEIKKDAADALAVAICHARLQENKHLLEVV